MRDLSKQEVMAVTGGLETITVTGTRGSENSIYPDAWQSMGMTVGEYLFGMNYGISMETLESPTFEIGPDEDATTFVGPIVDVDVDNDGDVDVSVQFGPEFTGDWSDPFNDSGWGVQVRIPF